MKRKGGYRWNNVQLSEDGEQDRPKKKTKKNRYGGKHPTRRESRS